MYAKSYILIHEHDIYKACNFSLDIQKDIEERIKNKITGKKKIIKKNFP